MASLASWPEHGEVILSLLFCRRLETKFERLASPGFLRCMGSYSKAIPQLFNFNPGLIIQVICR